MSKTLTIIAYCHAKPGQEKKLLAELLAMQTPSLAEPGCISYNAYVDAQDVHRVTMIEEWKDQAALNTHFASPHFQQLAAQLDTLLTEPPLIKRFAAIES